MFNGGKNYLFLILFHIVLGVVVFSVPAVSKLYAIVIILLGLYYVLITKSRNHEALYVAGYIVGSEVFLRMTGGNPLYEFSKYSVILFVLIGMYFQGFSKYATAYWIFLALMIPGVIVAAYTLNHPDMRKTISFNISGPVCLGLSSLYTYNRKITLKEVNNILLSIALPIISTTVYLILYTPSIRDVITGTGSNFATSGGFGPNQVATILGLGMFIFLSRLIFCTNSKIIIAVNVIVALVIGYRGLITFSRGGIITAIIMLIILLLAIYLRINQRGRMKMNYILVFISITFLAIWNYSAMETGGLIEKRYAGQNARGRMKESQFSGRETIAASEIKYFLANPIFGIGVGKGTEIRKDETGVVVLSHNEITRTIAEHGSFGIMALMILLFTPLILYLDNKENVYLVCFVVFWLLTINHAAMRLAAPAFIYALSLLKVQKL